MKIRLGLILICALAFSVATVSIPTHAAGQSKILKTDELTGRSEVIVVGKVNALKAEWNDDKSRIQTSVTIAVEETMKGGLESGTLTVLIPGGEVDGVGEWYSHSASFKTDEEVVVFAAKDKKGRYRVTSGERGKFQVSTDVKTGSKIIPNVGTLEEFTAQVKKNVKAQQSMQKDG